MSGTTTAGVGDFSRVKNGIFDAAQLRIHVVAGCLDNRRRTGRPVRFRLCHHAAALIAPIDHDICIKLVDDASRIGAIDAVSDVVIRGPHEFVAGFGSELVAVDKFTLRLQFDAEVIEVTRLSAARLTERPICVGEADVVMCVAVAEKAATDERRSIDLLNAENAIVKVHRAVDVGDIQIHVTDTARSEEANGRFCAGEFSDR